MRILNVAFKNLNSLAGEWRLDFEHPDFASDGLFLITGPTGSGKTTLLDAICLALYGRTPRVEPGKAQNEIMTRHTGECWAEATFETPEGRFRARWSQRRARKQSDARLQDDLHELTDATTDSLITSKKTEVPKKIKEISGLDFNQFTRAVMLAQGQFMKFLEASENDKSEILEKLTDTSIYSDLSSMAFERQKTEKLKLDELENKLTSLVLLDPEVERQKTEEMKICRENLARLEKERDSTMQKLACLDRIQKLEAVARELDEEKKDLLASFAKFEPKRKVLNDAKKVASLQKDYVALLSLRRQDQENRQKIAKLSQELFMCKEKTDFTRQKMEAEKANLAAKEKESEDAAPSLDKAAILDVVIGEKATAVIRSQTDLDEQKLVSERIGKEFDEASRKLASISAELAKTDAWLESHYRDEWLVENMNAIKGKLDLLASRRKNIEQLAADIEKAQKSLDDINKEIIKTKADIEAAHKAAGRDKAILSDLTDKRANLLQGGTLEDLREKLDEMRKKQLAAQLSKNFEEQRRSLHSGEPCPLCGAMDHPYVTGVAPEPDMWEIECKEIGLQIRDVERICREMEGIEAQLRGSDTRIIKLDTQLKGQVERQGDSQKVMTGQRNQEAELKQSILDLEAGIRADIEPLGLPSSQDLATLLQVLENRLADWRNMCNQKEKTGINSRDFKSRIAALKVEKEHADKNLASRMEALKLAQNQLSETKTRRDAILPGKTVEQEKNRLKKAIAEGRERLNIVENEYNAASKKLSVCEGALEIATKNSADLLPNLENAETGFSSRLAEKGIDETAYNYMAAPVDDVNQLEAEARELDTKAAELNARISDNSKRLADESAMDMTNLDKAGLEAALAQISTDKENSHRILAAVEMELRQNREKRQESAALGEKVDRQRAEYGKWSRLNDLIGSKDGKKFRAFVQNVTMDLLLENANRQLINMDDRYILTRAENDDPGKSAEMGKNKNLEILVVDNYQDGEIRTIQNLSGGEVFIISLALALGLSTMSGKNGFMGSLFMDEGFGTLDGEMLEKAIATLSALRRDGRIIGIISHVETLKERIPVKILLKRNSRGRSVLEGPGCTRRS